MSRAIFIYFFGSPQERETACELVDLLLRAADGNAEILQRALRHLGHPPDELVIGLAALRRSEKSTTVSA